MTGQTWYRLWIRSTSDPDVYSFTTKASTLTEAYGKCDLSPSESIVGHDVIEQSESAYGTPIFKERP